MEFGKRMANINSESKYEKIGSWYVSTRIPERFRSEFRDDINSLLTGNLSENIVNSQFILRYLAEEIGKKADELTLEEKIKLLKDDALKNKNSRSMTYVEHKIVGGSTSYMPPDPFVDLRSYIIGKPLDCHDKLREWIEKKGKYQLAGKIIQGDNIVYEGNLVSSPVSDNLGVSEEQYRELIEARSYRVIITINYKTREAKIDPLQK